MSEHQEQRVQSRPLSGAGLLAGTRSGSDEHGSPPGGAARFVGRERELTTLAAAIGDACEGRGGVVLLGGEPGIGKSRLAEEVARQGIANGARVVWGRCWDGQGAPPFWPWAQVVRGLINDYDPADLMADVGRGAPDLIPVMPELAAHFGDIAAPAAAPESDHGRFRFFDSFTTFVRAAAERRPLLFILDDLHWADPGSLLLLQFLAAEIASMRLVLVGTHRDVDPSPSPGLAHALADVARHRWSQRLCLGGFTQTEVAMFLANASGSEPPRALVSLVCQRTGGNPLFLAEMVRLLAKSEQADDGLNQWRHAIPETLKDTISRRTAAFEPETVSVLEAASVIGPRFALNLLQIVTGLEMERLLEALEPALAVRIVVEDEPRSGTYHFAHAIVGDFFYDRLPAARRHRFHGRVAGALERIHAGSAELPFAALAHHYGMASLGAASAKALEYAVRAGEEAMKHLAFEDAAMHYRRALEMLEAGEEPDRARGCRVLLALGDAQSQSGDWIAARQTYEGAAAMAREAQMPQEFARAAIGYKGTVFVVPHDVRAVNLLEEALDKTSQEDHVTTVRLLSALTISLHLGGSAERARQLATWAADLARRLGNPSVLAASLEALLLACWQEFDARHVEDTATEIYLLSTQCGDIDLAFRARMYRGWAFALQGNRQAAVAELDLSSVLASQSCHPRHRWQVFLVQGGRALAEGRIADAEAFSRSAQTCSTGFRDSAADHYEILQHYFKLRFRGTLAEAEGVSEMMARRFPDIVPYKAVLASVRAQVAAGASTDALLEFKPRDFARMSGIFRIFSLTQLAEACRIARDRERAVALYDLLLPHAAENVVVTWGAAFDGSVAHFLGLLAATLERWEEAERHFEDALAMNRAMEARPLVARTEHAYADMLLERAAPGDEARAADLLAAAIATFRTLDMPGHLSRAEALLAGVPVPGLEKADAHAPAVAEDATPRDPSPAAADEAPAGNDYVFRREGEYWTLTFRRAISRVRDTRGLRYLAALLQHPDREVHVIDLLGMFTVPTAVSEEHAAWSAADGGLRCVDPGAVVAGADSAARQEYRRRLAELQSDIEEAERFHDLGRAERLRAEFERIGSELGRAYGLGGRARRTGSAAERARVNVRNSIAGALRAIRRQDARLWRHLSTTIKTGACCSYRPEEPIPWQF